MAEQSAPDEYFGDLRRVRHAVRSYQAVLRAFGSSVASPDYGRDSICGQRHGRHCIQVSVHWNAAGYAPSSESSPARPAG